MNMLAPLRAAGCRRWLGALAVLVLGLKALLPTGYMLAAVDGHSRLVLCPAGLHRHKPVFGSATAAMVHAVGHATDASAGADQCPFALAGGAACLATVPVTGAPRFALIAAAPARASPSVPLSPPLRYHAPRGPPALT